MLPQKDAPRETLINNWIDINTHKSYSLLFNWISLCEHHFTKLALKVENRK
jgi:hypothetical protein